MKQLKLFRMRNTVEFGGSLLAGKRKTVRPFDSTKPLHLVLKATNPFALLQNRKGVEQIISKYATKLGIHVYDIAVNADHIHLVIRGRRELYHRWIRAVTSVLVRKFAGLKWKFRPYTRIAGWGRALNVLRKYLWKNRGEADLIMSAEKYVRQFAETIHQRLDRS